MGGDLLRPRPPIHYLKPVDPEPSRRRTCQISGVSSFLSELTKVGAAYDIRPSASPTPAQQLSEKRWADWQKELQLQKSWNPHNDQQIKGNPHATLVLYKLPRSLTEEILSRHFSTAGNVEYIRVVRDTRNKPRGYALVQFSQSSTARELAQHHSLTVEGHTIMCDMQRAKVQMNWRPKRLGGSLTYPKAANRHQRGNFSNRGRGGGRGNFGRGRRVDRPARIGESTPYAHPKPIPPVARQDPRAGGRSLRRY